LPAGAAVADLWPLFAQIKSVPMLVIRGASSDTLGIAEEAVVREVMLKETLDGEFTTVEEVAEAVLFFASFGSNALTGQSLTVSHGWSMR
jgi:NAD(P)-dependent dehydrogenase (short-subunit alcohol dehydrogenase family)